MDGMNKKRRIVGPEGRQMIANVYRFLKEEYEFTKLHQEPNCDLSHLRNITKRTAEATAVSERTVQKILREERDGAGTSTNFKPPKKRQRKVVNKIESEKESNVESNIESNVESKVEIELVPCTQIKIEYEEQPTYDST